MCQILEQIAAVFATRPEVQPILLMDTFATHICDPVLRRAADLGLMLCFIPASITFLLQPCDVFLFSGFKRDLARRCQEWREASASGRLDTVMWAQAVFEAIAVYVNQKRWARAFSHLGLRDATASFTSAVRLRTGLAQVRDALPAPALELPAPADVQLLWPRGRRVGYDQLMRLLR